MHLIQPLRQGKRKVGAYQCVLGISTIHRIPSECRMVAKILHLVFAEPAVPVGTTHPGDTNTAAQRHGLSIPFHNLADDLVTGNQTRT